MENYSIPLGFGHISKEQAYTIAKAVDGGFIGRFNDIRLKELSVGRTEISTNTCDDLDVIRVTIFNQCITRVECMGAEYDWREIYFDTYKRIANELNLPFNY